MAICERREPERTVRLLEWRRLDNNEGALKYLRDKAAERTARAYTSERSWFTGVALLLVAVTGILALVVLILLNRK